jgi:hypothetical protein
VIRSLDESGGAKVVHGVDSAQRVEVPEVELQAALARTEARAARLPNPAEYRRLAQVLLRVWGEGRPPRPFYDGLLSDGKSILVRQYAPPGDSTRQWLLYDVGAPDGACA